MTRRGLPKRLRDLEATVETQTRQEVQRVLARYRYDLEALAAHGTRREHALVLQYYDMLLAPLYEALTLYYLPHILPALLQTFYHTILYPVLLGETPQEDSPLIPSCDFTYTRLVRPDLWDRFLQEVNAASVGDPPQLPQDWQLSHDLATAFAPLHADLDRLKADVRAQRAQRMTRRDTQNAPTE